MDTLIDFLGLKRPTFFRSLIASIKMTTALTELCILVLLVTFCTAEYKRRFCHSTYDSIDFDFYAGGPLDLSGEGGTDQAAIVYANPFDGQKSVDMGIACLVEINCNLGDDAREKLLGCYYELKDDSRPFDYANAELCAKNDTERYTKIWRDFKGYSTLCLQSGGETPQCRISRRIYDCVHDLEGHYLENGSCDNDWRQPKYYHPQK